MDNGRGGRGRGAESNKWRGNRGGGGGSQRLYHNHGDRDWRGDSNREIMGPITTNQRGGGDHRSKRARPGDGRRGGGVAFGNHGNNQMEVDQPVHKRFERPGPVFGFKRLHGFLADTVSTDNVILAISKNKSDWVALLKSDEVNPSNSRNYLHLVMQVLVEKVIPESILRSQQVEICLATTEEQFRERISSLCTQICIGLGDSTSTENKTSNFIYVDKSPAKFLINLATYCRFLMKKMPSIVLDFLQAVISIAYGAAMSRSISDSETFGPIRDTFKALIDEVKSWSQKLKTKKIIMHKFNSRYRQEFSEEEEAELHAMEAPQNYKDMDIIPTAQELLSKEEVFLRPNKTKGAYQDAAHYLDVQFRLLREDFVRPLKDGIQDFMTHRVDYLSKRKKPPLGSIRIYTGVHIVSDKLGRDAVVYNAQLSPDGYKRVRWDKSKRLLPGSMLVFTGTKDFFRTAYFATVANRDVEELKKGVVSFVWEGDTSPAWDTAVEYLMVECEVYFESFRYTLQTLKELDLQDFPMHKFIVEASSSVSPPKYLEEAEHTMKIRLRNNDERNFSPLIDHEWPTPEELGLDNNQFVAYKAAITREFAIIQGPPGTGKTFLGLKIAETLLMNEEVTQTAGPIVVVCYTNHALDQFLEGILETYTKIPGAKGRAPIIRVGGRCKSEKLEEYILANVTKRERPRLPGDFYSNRDELRRQIDECRYRRSEMMYEISALKNVQGIVNLEKMSAFPQLRDEFVSPAIWANLKTPAWFGISDNRFSHRNFHADDFVRQMFQILDVPVGNVNHVAAASQHYESHPSTSAPQDPEETAPDDEEDYDVDELLANRIINVDNVFAESDNADVHSGNKLLYLAGISICDFDTEIFNLKETIKKLDEQSTMGPKTRRREIVMERNNISYSLAIAENKRSFLEKLFTYYRVEQIWLPDVSKILEQIRKGDEMEEILKLLPQNARWTIYFEIVNRARVLAAERAFQGGEKLIALQKRQRENQKFVDGVILRESKVVGMTTTGAAKYNDLLKMMRSKIVIVEEAAEVLEAHIVTCITKHCEHLILIGDHRQLQPNPNVFELATLFKLNISLFERMIKNDLNWYQLKLQHRMRPEIAALVKDTIYDELENAPKVYQYPPVMGVTKNLYFISHSELEKSETDSLSKVNDFEARYLGGLCRYLLLQDYRPDQITILTTYLGQMFALKKVLGTMANCKGVRVTCVDNFQGEENDIILLSLVRSNHESKIGFLSIENRVCVALSRARHGLFIIGNMTLLSDKSETWLAMFEKFDARSEIGPNLTIKCQIHFTETQISRGEEFQLFSPEGGCQVVCDELLSCTHRCVQVCHVKDRAHKEYACRQPCIKTCKEGHLCQSPCYRTCPPCLVLVVKSLQPKCHHEARMPCYKDPSEYFCREIVMKKLPCGHETELSCHFDPTLYPCKVMMDRTLPCTHERVLACHIDPAEVTCKVPTVKKLPCLHEKEVECRISPEMTKCEMKVERTLEGCGHVAEILCHQRDKKNIMCRTRCPVRLQCGHACTKYCHVLDDPHHLDYKCEKNCGKGCGEGHPCPAKHACCRPCPPCLKIMDRELPCLHQQKLPCHIDPTLYECKERCIKLLEGCGHQCQKLCYQPCTDCKIPVEKQGAKCGHKIVVPCDTLPTQDMCETLVPAVSPSPCGHVVMVPCKLSQLAPPSLLLTLCSAPCNKEFSTAEGGCGHECKGTCSSCWQGRFHQKCQEKCGRPLVCGDVCDFPCAKSCPPCNKQCHMKCEHSECRQKCGTPCLDCSEPCPWQCDHKRCTKLCRESCDRSPCDEPCLKRLPCGHSCLGFCGEPCPPICRVCNEKDEMFTIFFGDEDEEDARFVYLPDCKHSIEVFGLAHWMEISPEQDDEIGMKHCPRCKTLIKYCRRYNNLIRDRLKDVVAVKKKSFGNTENVKKIQNQIVQKLKVDTGNGWSANLKTFHEYLRDKVVDIVPVNDYKRNKLRQGTNLLVWKHKKVNEFTMNSIQFLVGCAESGIRTLTKARNRPELENRGGLKPELLDQLSARYLDLFANVRKRSLPLSRMEMRDIEQELERLFDLYQVYLRRSSSKFYDGHTQATPIYEKTLAIVEHPAAYRADRRGELHSLFKKMEDVLKTGLAISDMERRDILKVFAEKNEGRPGRWFKCRNGHYYIIGDCGGANQAALCFECKAPIGGTSYQIAPDNRLATEMDGATRSLWGNIPA